MTNQKGQIMILSIIVLAVIMVSTLVTIGGAQVYFSNSNYTAQAEKATALAEAGLDKAVASLNKTGGTYNGESETTFGDGSYSVTITSKNAATKIIESTGFLPNKTSPKVKRTLKIEASKGIGVSFVYGIQVGEGGLELGNNNTVIGSIYSNGNISGKEDNKITGDVWVAEGRQPNPDQIADCGGVNCSDFIFGKNVSSELRLDVAQSFKPSIENTLNKVSLKIKKIGNPADLTVRILQDKDGKPDKGGVLASGILYASLVTSNYAFIDVTFDKTPNLKADTTYWVMVDGSENSLNFWSWQTDLAQSYTRGSPKWSSDWQDKDSSWNNILADLAFKTYMGGLPTSISGGKHFVVDGDVHANTIDEVEIRKDAYYQLIKNSKVLGNSIPASADPAPKVFPISEANVTAWKQEAQDLGVTIGDIIKCPQILGPGKIVGNVSLDQCKQDVMVKSPIWITGNFNLENKNTLRLSSEFGTTSGLIIVDGLADFNNGNKLLGTGQGSSLLMFLSTYDSRTSNVPAIRINDKDNSGVLYAGSGIIEPGNNNAFQELTGWGIRLTNNSTLTYQTGLSSTLFSSGPSGSYSLIKGTYQVK